MKTVAATIANHKNAHWAVDCGHRSRACLLNSALIKKRSSLWETQLTFCSNNWAKEGVVENNISSENYDPEARTLPSSAEHARRSKVTLAST